MADAQGQEINKGDQVTWQWSGGRPGGEVANVKAGEVSITSHRGNEIKKSGDEQNPAVHITKPGNDVVKKASEIDVESKAEGGKTDGEKKDGGEGLSVPEKKGRGKSKSKSPAPPTTAAATTAAPASAPEKKQEEAAPQKNGQQANGEAKKKGRPKGAASKPKSEKPKKRAATETGEPRRSKRVKS